MIDDAYLKLEKDKKKKNIKINFKYAISYGSYLKLFFYDWM